MIIKKLTDGSSGSFRDALGVYDEEVIDISADGWKSTLASISNWHFDRFRLSDTAVRPEFVDCWFEDCEFTKLRSADHFWGNGNGWKNCRFERVKLDRPIASYNRFSDCSFCNVTIRGYCPMGTVFVGCRFENVMFEGLDVSYNTRNSLVRQDIAEKPWGFPELAELDERRRSLLFRDCDLQGSTFKHCILNYTWLDQSRFADTAVEGSDLSEVTADHVWWKPEDATRKALLQCYHAIVLQEIEKKVGVASASLRHLQDYLAREDWSVSWLWYLMDHRIPHTEFKVVDRIYESLATKGRFPTNVYPQRT